MKDHKGCVRAFYQDNEGCIMFGMFGIDDGGGTSGEMSMKWVEFSDGLAPQLRVFDDGWSALSLFPDLIQKMGEVDDENITPAQFVEMLLSCGFKDFTKYESPYSEKEK